jgi:hypothetical protein
MSFLSRDMNDHNLTQEDVTPVYLAMLYKAAKAYCQKKDKREQSSQRSSSTVSDFLLLTEDELSSFIAAPLVAEGAKLIPPPKQGKEHLIVTKTPTKVEEAALPLPTVNDLITPALWNLQIPQQLNETSGDFGKCHAAVDHLMSDPMMAALLLTMVKTSDIYIKANHFASNHKTPELGPTRDMDQNSHRALDPQLPVVKPIRPSQ